MIMYDLQNKLKINIIKDVDDFIYCYSCNCYHYKNAHLNRRIFNV